MREISTFGMTLVWMKSINVISLVWKRKLGSSERLLLTSEHGGKQGRISFLLQMKRRPWVITLQNGRVV